MTRITDRRIDRVIEHLDIATRVKPGFDLDVANDLAVCDIPQANETGISGQGTINDPVVAQVLARSHVLDRSNRVDALVSALEGTARELVAELNRGKRRTPAAQGEPLCSGGDPSTWGDPTCGRVVDHFTRDDGTIGYRADGLCGMHRVRKHRHEQAQVA